MQQTVISKLHMESRRQKAARIGWNSLVCALLYTGAVLALAVPGRDFGLPLVYWILPAVIALGICLLADSVQKKWVHTALLIVPWFVLVLLWNVRIILRGGFWWINCVLDRWNELHQGGVPLFAAEGTDQSILAIATVASFAFAWIFYRIATRRHVVIGAVIALALLFFQSIMDGISSWPCGFLISGILGLWITQKKAAPQMQAVRIWAACAIAILICFWLKPGTEMKDVTDMRNATKKEIHTLRYGENLLPEGDLWEAGKLHAKADEVLLKVQTSQVKNLYLRGFSGSEYADGTWEPLPDSAYTGVYTGLLSWLADQNFDPLTQPSSYYALSNAAANASVQTNTIQLKVTGASRYYIYTPSSTATLSSSRVKEDDDVRFLAPGIRGLSSYTVQELSSSKPTELTVREDWISNPETEEQQQYVKAEKYYRDFVYEKYLTVDENLAPILEELFWTDYEPENDGTYEAVTQVRKVLQDELKYDSQASEYAERTEDPLHAFLTGKKSGNAVLYASAAVEALRSHSIPARYVEGYYVSASEIEQSDSGMVSVTGQNAHAWVEVYFDGIGWMPIDVTPGYYYDALTLQQMIALPDAVRKTAILEKNNQDGGEVTNQDSGFGNQMRPGEIAKNVTLIVLGAAAVVIILIVLFLLIMELLRIFANRRERMALESASPSEKILLMKKQLFALMALWGMDAAVGWKTEKTDEELAARFEMVEPGEYMRAAALIEKSIYGEMELEPFEVRVIQNLINKLSVTDCAGSKMYWKLHYRCVIN